MTKLLGASFCWLPVFALCVSSVRINGADEPAKTVALEKVPVAARKTIQEEAGHAAIGKIQTGEEDGKQTYTVSLGEGGHDRQLTVAADGTLLSKDLTLEQCPPPVGHTIQGQLKGGTLENIAETYDNDDIYFEVTATRKDGTERAFSVGLDGKLLSVDVALEEIPAAVRKTIETSLGGGKLENVTHMFEEDGNSYYVEFMRNGQERDLSVGEDGKLQSMEVFLPELSPAVQKTIREKLGEGTVVRIDKSFEVREEGFPYEVEGRKDGRPFNFSVSPRGKFLGLDE